MTITILVNIPFDHFGGLFTIKVTHNVTLWNQTPNFSSFRLLDIVIIIANINKQVKLK